MNTTNEDKRTEGICPVRYYLVDSRKGSKRTIAITFYANHLYTCQVASVFFFFGKFWASVWEYV